MKGISARRRSRLAILSHLNRWQTKQVGFLVIFLTSGAPKRCFNEQPPPRSRNAKRKRALLFWTRENIAREFAVEREIQVFIQASFCQHKCTAAHPDCVFDGVLDKALDKIRQMKKQNSRNKTLLSEPSTPFRLYLIIRLVRLFWGGEPDSVGGGQRSNCTGWARFCLEMHGCRWVLNE